MSNARTSSALLALALVAAGCGGRVVVDGPLADQDASTAVETGAIDSGTSPGDDASIGPTVDSSMTGDAVTVIDGGVDGGRETSVTKCTGDGECSGATPRCDATTGTCAGCAASSCTSFGAVCDPASGACVECTRDADCGTGRVCDLGSHSCTRSCSTTSPCRRGTTCDPKSGACVECLTDADCRGGRCEPGTQVCVECLTAADCRSPTPICDPVHTCTLSCTGEADCAPFRAHCDLSVGRCFECYRNDQCNTGEFCQPDRTCGGGG